VRTLGYSCKQLLAKRLADMAEPEHLPRVRGLYEARAAGGPDIPLTRRYVRKDGARVCMLDRVSANRAASGRASSLLAPSLEPTGTQDGPG
jgi:PAS domain S-box-containing protein